MTPRFWQAKMAARAFALFCVVAVFAAAGAAVDRWRHEPLLRFPTLPLEHLVSRPTASPLPSRLHYVGVFKRGVPTTYAPVAQFARIAGRPPQIAVYFSAWGAQFRARFAAAAQMRGAIVLVQLEPHGQSMAAIAAGRDDRYLRSYARQVRGYGRHVIISFAPEPNGPWYPWGWRHTDPVAWVNAWRHLVKLFRAQGAVNVTWLWDMVRSNHVTGPIADWWPGASYVNWVGLDGYYFRPADSYQFVFGRTVRQIRRFTRKPLLIAEAGIGPTAGQAAKLPGLFRGIRRDHLLGLVWFDVAQHRGIYHQNWRLEGHPAAIIAFQAGVNSLTPASVGSGVAGGAARNGRSGTRPQCPALLAETLISDPRSVLTPSCP